MATKDLYNEITPTHQRRPVRVALADLRSAITTADTGGKYSAGYLGNCNRNDLIAIARSLGVNLPFPFVP